jgi:adenylate cyclase
MLDSSIFRDQMTVRRLRLGAGLIMLCYLTLHFCMHALGNVSFEAMQWGTRIHDFVWHSVPGTIALYGALATHFTLALYALYSRRSFRMGAGELVRLLLGFSILPLLFHHFAAERYVYSAFDVTRHYDVTLTSFFISFRSGGGGKSLCSWSLGRMGVSACITGYVHDPIITNLLPYCSPRPHSCQCSLCSGFGRARAMCSRYGNCTRSYCR